MEDTERKIIHIDADCFYAAVEMRDNALLRDCPLAVGGAADRRGVITTCNYQARAFGVRSAMPSAQALRLCPQLLIVRPRFDAYREASRGMRDVFADYTELVEPLALDEAFLDVTGVDHCQGSATRMAEEIRARISQTLALTVSAGVAPNKFLAKVASDWHKPDGLCVVRPEQVGAFVERLPVGRILGVGKVTAARMAQLGIRHCGDLQRYELSELVHHFGRFGERLYALCRGQDRRPVEPQRRRKSLSVERTFTSNLTSLAQCLERIGPLSMQLQQRLADLSDDYVVARLLVKVKFADFTQTTVAQQGVVLSAKLFEGLCRRAYLRAQQPVRLLGVGVGFAEAGQVAQVQLDLFR